MTSSLQLDGKLQFYDLECLQYFKREKGGDCSSFLFRSCLNIRTSLNNVSRIHTSFTDWESFDEGDVTSPFLGSGSGWTSGRDEGWGPVVWRVLNVLYTIFFKKIKFYVLPPVTLLIIIIVFFVNRKEGSRFTICVNLLSVSQPLQYCYVTTCRRFELGFEETTYEHHPVKIYSRQRDFNSGLFFVVHEDVRGSPQSEDTRAGETER